MTQLQTRLGAWRPLLPPSTNERPQRRRVARPSETLVGALLALTVLCGGCSDDQEADSAPNTPDAMAPSGGTNASDAAGPTGGAAARDAGPTADSTPPVDPPDPPGPVDPPTPPPQTDGYRIGETPCGNDGEGRYLEREEAGGIVETTVCLESGPRAYDGLNLGAGGGSPEWNYDQAAAPAHGLHGWSYYIRAFDMVRDTPVQEIGWGQWTKPSVPANGLDVCGLHPHGFVCETEEEGGAPVLEGDLANCGHLDWQRLAECRSWCCAEPEKCGVRGSIEGGMGYWMYTLETPQVKWMLPGATNANYEIFGGTFLHDRPQPCSTLGGAVRVSNTLLVPNDFVSFAGNDVNGFMGYMLSRTPIGKRSATDDANYWTIVIDAANFAGPVMYMSAWFWDSRINWHPNSVSWSDPRALIGYIAEGFEGKVGAIKVTDGDGAVWRRTNRWAFPQDTVDGRLQSTSTLFTGHSQYTTDWAATAMEPMLAGTGNADTQTPAAIARAAAAARTAPESCNLPEDQSGLEVELDSETEGDEIIWGGFGVGDLPVNEGAEQAATDAASCHTRVTLDATKLDCETSEGWCEGSPYLKLAPDGYTSTVVRADEVPADVMAALHLRRFERSRRNDGRYLGPPAETESECFDTPGPAPADSRLYCTRTQSGTWVGFRWYRFIDQPELNQVFASLPEGEREAARCYMQARIERLHEAQQRDAGSVPSWFAPPNGETHLPGNKVSIDRALLLTPPPGLETGFVPIPVYERKYTKPQGCDVVVGETAEEPTPIPADYYQGYAYDGGGYDLEYCPANSESGGQFTYPGVVFPYSPGPDQAERTAYTVPARSELTGTLDAAHTVCGLPSDPPQP